MVSKTTRKGSLFLAMNLLCYILAAAAGNNGGGGGFGGSNDPFTNPGQPPATCPINVQRIGVCANLLGEMMGGVVGNPPTSPCCTLLAGLVDLEAAVCLCAAIRANVLGINLYAQLVITLLLNVCGRTLPPGFICA